MPYTIENSAGDILGDGKNEAEAIEKARAMLSDDPELGELLVLEWREVATVTHAPDADWQSVVVVLKPGEKVEPPDDSWKMPADEVRADWYAQNRAIDGSGYALSNPKHPDWHSIHADIWDARAGK